MASGEASLKKESGRGGGERGKIEHGLVEGSSDRDSAGYWNVLFMIFSARNKLRT